MNKNLKELEDKALQHEDLQSYDKQRFIEIFSDLIVNTCVEIVEAQKISWRNTQIPPEVVLDMTVKNIKSYFLDNNDE